MMSCMDTITSIQFCPRCRASRTMFVTFLQRIVTAVDGKKTTLISKTFHCECCCSFVRSTEEA